MNFEKLTAALNLIAKNPDWRNEFIRQILNFEKNIYNQGLDVRELMTGPIVDALFEESQIIRKNLLDGTILDFYYRSKIARDFVMSEPEIPTHAWEPQTTKLLVNLAVNAKQAVIGGAYFGDHAIMLAKQMVKNDGLVHAFEPNDDQRGMLEHNAKLNNLDNIRPRKEGLWDNSSTTLKLVGDDSFAHPEAVKEGASGGFRTITIENYMSDVGSPKIDLIMLDIEGAELKVLQGAKRFLAMPADSAPNIVFEVHRSYVDWSGGISNTDILKFLNGFGYKVYAVRDFNSNFDLSKNPIELIPADFVNLDGPPHGFNMVAVKDESIFSNPAYRFCKNVSPKLLRHKNPAMHHPIDGL